jgi:hypothetical protein
MKKAGEKTQKNIMRFIRNYFILSCTSFITLLGCNPQDNSLLSDEKALTQLVKRVNLNKSQAKEAKEYIINNKIYVWDLWEPIPYKDSIDWTINPYNNKSWYLYFQSLRMVGFLAQDYKYSKDPLNISKAKEIIYAWHKTYNKDFFPDEDTKLSKKVWNDHAVANRVLNLMHAYFTFEKEESLRFKIKEILYHHGVWLADQKNYTQGNHAVMIDRALLQLSQLFRFPESYQWEDLAKLRLKNIFDKEVTKEGAATENSAGYHFYVLDLLIDCVNLFEVYNIDYSEDWTEMISKMISFGDQMLKPDNTIPTIGDTYKSKYAFDIFDKYADSAYIYSSSFTKKGENLNIRNKVYPKSGYAFFKENPKQLDSSSFVNRTYLSFINTNLSPVHKHNDFLSIILTSNKEDLIIDAGHLGYEKDSITSYIRSTFAHSVLTINNKDFNFKEISSDQVLISDFEVNEDYSYVKGTLKVDEFTTINRSLYFLEPNQILMFDELDTKKQLKSFNQIFNLGNSFTSLEQVSIGKVKLKFETNNLIIEQLNSIEKINFKLFNSDFEKGNFRGIRADGYGKVKDGQILKFDLDVDNNKTSKSSFVTLLTIENKRFYESKWSIETLPETILLKKNGSVLKELKK